MEHLGHEFVLKETLKYFELKKPQMAGENVGKKTSFAKKIHKDLVKLKVFPTPKDTYERNASVEYVKKVLKTQGKSYFTFVVNKGIFILKDQVGRIVPELYGSVLSGAQSSIAQKIARAEGSYSAQTTLKKN